MDAFDNWLDEICDVLISHGFDQDFDKDLAKEAFHAGESSQTYAIDLINLWEGDEE